MLENINVLCTATQQQKKETHKKRKNKREKKIKEKKKNIKHNNNNYYYWYIITFFTTVYHIPKKQFQHSIQTANFANNSFTFPHLHQFSCTRAPKLRSTLSSKALSFMTTTLTKSSWCFHFATTTSAKLWWWQPSIGTTYKSHAPSIMPMKSIKKMPIAVNPWTNILY